MPLPTHLCESCGKCTKELNEYNRQVYGQTIKTKRLMYWCNKKMHYIHKWCVFCEDYTFPVNVPVKIRNRIITQNMLG